MAKKCKSCGAEISYFSSYCPNCGRRYRFSEIVIIILIIILGLVVLLAAKKFSNNENIDYIVISVEELEDELENSYSNAKSTYNGKYLEVTGRLEKTNSEYVTLYSPTNEWDVAGVHCVITDDEQIETLNTLSEDDIITIRGKVTTVGEVESYYMDIIEILIEE